MKPAICLRWRSRLMPAPSFWYYTLDAMGNGLLNQALSHMAGRCSLYAYQTEVPVQVPLYGEEA